MPKLFERLFRRGSEKRESNEKKQARIELLESELELPESDKAMLEGWMSTSARVPQDVDRLNYLDRRIAEIKEKIGELQEDSG